MKKALIILLSLFLIFSLISCDDEIKLVDATNEDCESIAEIFLKIKETDPATYRYEYHYLDRYTIKEGSTLNYKNGEAVINASINGQFTLKIDSIIDEDKLEDTVTYNGTINIGADKYELSNVVSYVFESDEIYNRSITGDVKKNDTPVDLSTLETSDPALSAFFDSNSGMYDCERLLEQYKCEFFITDFPGFEGEITTKGYRTDDTIVLDYISDFSKVTLSDGKEHSLNCEIKIFYDIETDTDSFDVVYLSFDGEYFTPASLLANEEVSAAITKFLLS